MRRFSLLCLVVFLAVVGTYLVAGRYGRNESTGAWGAIVMASLLGAAVNYFRFRASVFGAFLCAAALPFLSALVGGVVGFFASERPALPAAVGVATATLIAGLAVAEGSGVKARWIGLVTALMAVGAGLVASR